MTDSRVFLCFSAGGLFTALQSSPEESPSGPMDKLLVDNPRSLHEL